MNRRFTLYMDETGSRHPDMRPDASRAGRDWFAFGGVLVHGEDNEAARGLVEDFAAKWKLTAPAHLTDMRVEKKAFAWLARRTQARRSDRDRDPPRAAPGQPNPACTGTCAGATPRTCVTSSTPAARISGSTATSTTPSTTAPARPGSSATRVATPTRPPASIPPRSWRSQTPDRALSRPARPHGARSRPRPVGPGACLDRGYGLRNRAAS